MIATVDEQIKRSVAPVIKVDDIAYLIFGRPDLEKTQTFLEDFGLTVAARNKDALFFRGAGPAHHCYIARRSRRPSFVGTAFRAKSIQDLARLADAENTKIETIDDPGGGQRVVLTDPNGFRVEVIFGDEKSEILDSPPPPVTNNSVKRARVNTPLRAAAGPPVVQRLGHVVLETPYFSRSVDWYASRLGLIPSDVLHLETGDPVVAFMRCDRGDDPADHHTLVLGTSLGTGFNHAAFEVSDIDALAAGEQHLRSKGWKHSWGIGRHLLGSQIFDYWYDPYGDKVEHFTDGDVFDASAETAYHPMSNAELYQWGPDLPKGFIDPRITPRRLWDLIGYLRRSDDLTINKLRALKRVAAQRARPWR
jgi:catechol 2,3-dioxygenase-like lactoylglutathione lyase family enzyme